MTDQITDDNREKIVRNVISQIDGHVNGSDFYMGHPAEWLRDLRRAYPAPPKSLADELRYRATLLCNGDPDGDTPAALNHLADRVETLETEAEGLKIERDQSDYLMENAIRERDEARAEVERLAAVRERQEKALTEHGQALSLARAEVERLTTENVTTDRICDAWENPGRRPSYHLEMQAALREKWPTLTNAIQDLCRERTQE